MTKLKLTLLGALVVLAIAAVPASASASGIKAFEAFPSTTQAGGHPNVTIHFKVDYAGDPSIDNSCSCNNIKDADIELPTGLIGNPHATPQCNAADFAREVCPVDSQIGQAEPLVKFGRDGTIGNNDGSAGGPFFNLVPKPTQAGLLAWRVPLFNTPIYTVISARTGGDYGLNAFTDGIEQSLVLEEFTTRLWGVPADPSNDKERYGKESNSPRTPFLSNPTTCAEPLHSVMTERGFDGEVHVATSPWPQTTGCDQLAFNPSLSARPTTTEPDAPSGLEVDLKVPQQVSADAPSPSEIHGTTLILPKGFSINPGAADGKVSCTDEEANFGTELEAQCPDFSKIGTTEIESSALPAPIPGSVYLGVPLPGNRYRIFLTGDGYATHVKLAGVAELNYGDGQVVLRFDDLPQAPLTEFNLHVFGAERGVMATPTQCGTYAVESIFTPWDEALAKQSSKQFFQIESGPGGSACPPAVRPFSPGFGGSSVSNAAGEHTPFTVNLTRNDGDQNLKELTVRPPRGLLGTLAGIPYCSEATLSGIAAFGSSGIFEQTAPACPNASRVGVSDVGAGPGTQPVHLPGKVYLAGPYKGAPLSLAVVTPAVSGPYDLGNVVVRAALFVDPWTAQVTTVSDSLPQIHEGIPLRLRSLMVSLDKPGFTLNPTNCTQLSADATIGGDQGASVERSVPFQVANCSIMPFAPKLALKLSGSVHRTGNPAIKATLRAAPGEANIATTTVTMPHTLFLDNSHLNAPCTPKQFNANACPEASILGSARAVSPLLAQPLEGPVYLKVSNHKLPDIVASLHGQIDFNLAAHIDSVKQRLRARFESVPDVPVTEFNLNLFGAKRGLVENSDEVCDAARTAAVRFGGQNGRNFKENVRIKTPCGTSARKKRANKRADGRNH